MVPHRQCAPRPWPTSDWLREAASGADVELVGAVGQVLASLRKLKSEAKTSQKTPILEVTLELPEQLAKQVELVRLLQLEGVEMCPGRLW